LFQSQNHSHSSLKKKEAQLVTSFTQLNQQKLNQTFFKDPKLELPHLKKQQASAAKNQIRKWVPSKLHKL
jgi:hypothetical protein